MTRILFCGLVLTLTASLAVASEVVTARSERVTPVSQTQLAPPLSPPALSPTPDPLFTPSNQQLSKPSLYAPSNPSVYTPSSQSLYPPSTPMLTPQYPVAPQPMVGQPVPLFTNVRYRATRNIAPCAVPTIVQVADPCNRDRNCKTCVNVEVCVPPCDPKDVHVTRDGNRVRYDYGKYAVVIRSVGDHLVVHYAD